MKKTTAHTRVKAEPRRQCYSWPFEATYLSGSDAHTSSRRHKVNDWREELESEAVDEWSKVAAETRPLPF